MDGKNSFCIFVINVEKMFKFFFRLTRGWTSPPPTLKSLSVKSMKKIARCLFNRVKRRKITMEKFTLRSGTSIVFPRDCYGLPTPVYAFSDDSCWPQLCRFVRRPFRRPGGYGVAERISHGPHQRGVRGRRVRVSGRERECAGVICDRRAPEFPHTATRGRDAAVGHGCSRPLPPARDGRTGI